VDTCAGLFTLGQPIQARAGRTGRKCDEGKNEGTTKTLDVLVVGGQNKEPV
jgi:hypothetical protein